jgi:hypothetical protein
VAAVRWDPGNRGELVVTQDAGWEVVHLHVGAEYRESVAAPALSNSPLVESGQSTFPDACMRRAEEDDGVDVIQTLGDFGEELVWQAKEAISRNQRPE